MVLPVALLFFLGAIVLLFRFLSTRHDARTFWRSSVAIGAIIGLMRAALACVGWYGVEHTGGPLQIPAFALAMLAWPEAILLGRHRGPVAPTFYPILALLLLVTSMLMVGGVSLAVQLGRRPRGAED
jgi:hypothetical protein